MRWLCRVVCGGGPIRSQHEDESAGMSASSSASASKSESEGAGEGEGRQSAATNVVIGVHEMNYLREMGID